MAIGLASAQPMLDLQESPPASGLLTARLTSSYTTTGFGGAKIWTFNAEANDRVTFLVRTDSGINANPVIRLVSPSGSTVSQGGGSYDGFASLENVALPTPGVYQVAIYSDSKASAFSLSALLGRGVELESEINDIRTLADRFRFSPQGGGFRGTVAGVLDRDADWIDLGTLIAGQTVNLSLQPPAGSSLSASAVELALFKDSDTSALLVATGGSLVHSVASGGNYRVRVRVPDLDGRNLRFEGSQSVSLGNPEALRITGSQTIEFWIKPDNFNSRQNPYAKAYAGEGTMTIETDGTVNYFYGTGGGNTAPYQTFNTGTPLRAGRWQHLALVRDFSSTPKQLRWYLDGRLVAQAEASHFPAVASSLDATIGTGYAGNLYGSMDEIRIWNSPRSGTEILDNLDNSLAGTESGLVAYYRFSEGAGASTADGSTSGITGAIAGVPAWEGTASANLPDFMIQGQNSSYFLNASVSDTSAPSVTAVDLIPNRGHLIEGTSFAPSNMSALAGNQGQSYLYTLQGETGGSIAGTDTYSVDSSLGKAAVHAGILLPSEIGAVRVTIQPGLSFYYASSRNGVSSASSGSGAASYRIERYVPAVPFALDAIYSSLSISFDEEMDEASLASGVTLAAAGPDGNLGNGDDISYPLTFSSFTGDRRSIFLINDNRLLLPGAYRLTVPATVSDRAGNVLASAYVKNFTVLGIGGYANEDGDNGSLATADTVSTGVLVQGDGSFLDAGRTVATAGWPFDIETADLDGDGRTDAAVTHLGSVDGLRIYPGNGTRGFGTPVVFDGIADEPYDVQLVDWDKDGDMDLAVTLAGTDEVGLFRNDSTPGNPVFVRQADVAVGDYPRRLAPGDFNADGYPDLVVSNNGTDGTTGYSVSVLLNDKAGSFTESRLGLSLAPKIRPWGITSGDFNKDGKADLAVGDMDNGDRLAVFLGVGDGTFGAPSFLDMPDGPNVSDLKVADFNRDGNPDLVAVANDNPAYSYWIFPGNGDGTFGTRVDFLLNYGYYNEFVKVADVNGDSWPDLLLGGYDHLTVASNRADGTFGFGYVRRNWYNTYGVAAADLDGDG
ncbi:FG-GAP-like repeat-containing protein, partial [Luteolibacter yonseiensis]|uniref:FG-GAP-like repeat-containing protein n=1 Tax=Luteolibacter yonseiensis TaxID=1144680 RepID=UPI0031ED6B51